MAGATACVGPSYRPAGRRHEKTAMHEDAETDAALAEEDDIDASDGEIVAALDEEEAADAGDDPGQPADPLERIGKRRERLPLSHAQLRNLAVRFHQHREECDALRAAGVQVKSLVRYPDRGDDFRYGVVTKIDGPRATVERGVPGGRTRSCSVPVSDLTVRIPRLSNAKAEQWSIDEYIDEGPERVRGEYKDWCRRIRMDRVVSKYSRYVLAQLPSTFTRDDFVKVATTAGVRCRTNARWLLWHFYGVSKKAVRLPKQPGEPRKYQLVQN